MPALKVYIAIYALACRVITPEQINKAIIEFARDTPEGIKLLNDMGYGGLKPIVAEELRLLEPYAAMLKKALTKAP